ALDVLLYAPVGLAVTAAEELPKLIEKGRERVSGQVALARAMGEFAAKQGQEQAEKLFKDASERATQTFSNLGGAASTRPAPSGDRPPRSASTAPESPVSG